MTDLTPVGLSKDGESLILASSNGVEFTVLIDHKLRAALRGDTRLGQVEKKPMNDVLRPRDIQNRIRAGASVTELAEAAGTTTEKLMAYAGPVIAEREYIAELAQKASLRRGHQQPRGHGGARTLVEAVGMRASELHLPLNAIAWDAWRRDDGRWTIVAEYAHNGVPRRAVFAYDAPGRYVTAENDEARVLTGEHEPDQLTVVRREPVAPVRAIRLDTSEPSGNDRVTSAMVNSSLVLGHTENHQDHTAIGEDAIELVRRSTSEEDLEHDVAETLLTGNEPTLPLPTLPIEQATPSTMEASSKKKKMASSKKRPKVPSWDEIMFGSKPDESI